MRIAPARVRELLVHQFPKCFKRKGAVKLPLKIGIHDDIFKLWSGVEMADIKAGLADYTDGPKYLNSCFPGAARYGLDGLTAGIVTDAQHCHSVRRLKALAASWSGPITFEIKESPMCGSSKPAASVPAVSQNAFIKPEIEPSLLPADEAARHMLNSLTYSSATAFLAARDAANVDFGRRQAVEAATNIQPRTLTLLTQLLSALQSGQKIEAIKLVRAGTGMSLKEAKDWVEALQMATPQIPAPVSANHKTKGYMVLHRDQTDYGGVWNLHNTLSYLSDAKVSAEGLAQTGSPGSEVLLVEVLGQTKPVFSMRAA